MPHECFNNHFCPYFQVVFADLGEDISDGLGELPAGVAGGELGDVADPPDVVADAAGSDERQTVRSVAVELIGGGEHERDLRAEVAYGFRSDESGGGGDDGCLDGVHLTSCLKTCTCTPLRVSVRTDAGREPGCRPQSREGVQGLDNRLGTGLAAISFLIAAN